MGIKNEITKVLIFQDGYYYLTVAIWEKGNDYNEHLIGYKVADIEYNGFEFASDAYSYLAAIHETGVLNE